MDNFYYEYFRDEAKQPALTKGESAFPGPACNMHFHKSVELLFFKKGRSVITVEDEEFPAEENDIFFINGFYRHMEMVIEPTEKYLVIIPQPYSSDFERLLSRNTLPAYLGDREFNASLKPIFERACNDENQSIIVKRGYLNVIVGELLSHYPTVPIKKFNPTISCLMDVLKYIDLHFAENITLDLLADTFGYNRSYFSTFFNKCVGETLTNYLNVVRLQHFLSLSPEKGSITSRAFSCGFNSLPTFYRAFRKAYGVSPNEYFTEKKS